MTTNSWAAPSIGLLVIAIPFVAWHPEFMALMAKDKGFSIPEIIGVIATVVAWVLLVFDKIPFPDTWKKVFMILAVIFTTVWACSWCSQLRADNADHIAPYQYSK